MFIILDILLVLIIIIIVFMVFSGFISLLDRNVMAMTQNRVGPALFLFGLCTPIFDGVNLVLNFGLLVLNVDLLYLFLIIVSSLLFNYGIFFMIPTANIILININHNHFIFLALHTMLSVINVFLVGCFIINTCFVYLATIRTILFSIISEFCILIVFIYIFNIHFFAMQNFLLILVFNIILSNFLCFPIFVILLIILVMYLYNLINIFEFSEAESELVAGTITEFSGVFFCISSLIEIAHIILSVYLLLTILLGGFFLHINYILFLVLLFLVPNLLLCSLNINNALLFIFFYLLIYLFLYLLFINIINLICLIIY